MPAPTRPNTRLTNWAFTSDTSLRAQVVSSDFYDPGIMLHIQAIKSIADYPDGTVFIKTHAHVYETKMSEAHTPGSRLPIKKSLITAELKNWGFNPYGNCYFGNIYGDAKRRYPDGQRVFTSEVLKTVDRSDHLLVYTQNSLYKLMHSEKKRDLL